MNQQEPKKTAYVRHVKDKYILRQDAPNIEAEWEILPTGMYKSYNLGGLGPRKPGYLSTQPVEQLISFKEGAVAKVLEKTDTFFSPEVIADYNRIKVAHKMGILMHGKPGVGKTSCAYLIMQQLIEKYQAVCIDFTGQNVEWVHYICSSIRDKQPHPIVAFIDEFEYAVKAYEPELLTFLDGSDSIPGVIVLACTNHLNRIPDRVKYRKSRIKYLLEIKSFPFAVYKQYISEKVEGINEQLLGEISYHCVENGLTMDEVKHILIDHFIEKIPIAEIFKASEETSKTEIVELKKPDDADNTGNSDQY